MQHQQIEDEIKRIISIALYQDLRDPAFQDMTITRVKVARDLQFADVRFTSRDTLNEVDVIEEKVNRAAKAFRGVLAKKLRIRKIPQLRFHYDKDILAEQRIEDVLNKIKAEQHDD